MIELCSRWEVAATVIGEVTEPDYDADGEPAGPDCWPEAAGTLTLERVRAARAELQRLLAEQCTMTGKAVKPGD